MDGLTVGAVVGVTPDRWARAWRERMPAAPLRIEPVDDPAAALAAGTDLVFARLPVDGVDIDAVHVIPLWEETPVVVAAKDHPVKAFEAVTEADLAGEEVRPGWDDGVLDLVAAGHGIARMPQSVFRATGRRDLVARPITDAEPTRIGLVWSRTNGGALVDEFIGIVRGRTANSSRGTQTEVREPERRPSPRARTSNGRRGAPSGARRHRPR